MKRKISQQVSPQFQSEQRQLLNKMYNFVKSKKCRRVGILENLDAEPSEYQRLTIEEQCCDNCHESLNGGIPLNLAYDNLRHDSKLDCSQDARQILACLNSHTINSAYSMMVGEIPDSGEIYDLRYFGVGKNKPKEYWKALLPSLVKEAFYMDFRLTKKAKSFLRNKLQTVYIKPTKEMLQFLKKRENVEFFWQGNQVQSRAKYSNEELQEIQDIAGIMSLLSDEEFEAPQGNSLLMSQTEKIVIKPFGESNASFIKASDLSEEEKKETEEWMKILSEESDMENQATGKDGPPLKVPKLF